MRKRQSIYRINDMNSSNEELMLYETIFHNANGYIGIRSNYEEGYPKEYDSIRGSYINGFYDLAKMKQAEKLYGLVEEKQTMVNVVDTQGIELLVGGERFSMFTGEVLESERWLDMDLGYTVRRVVWRSPQGKEIEIQSKRMTSFTQLSLFSIEYSVTALNCEEEVELRSYHIGEVMNYSNPHDPRVAGESFQHLVPNSSEIIEGVSYLVTDTSLSGLSVATGVSHEIKSVGKKTESRLEDWIQTIELDGHKAICNIKGNIKEGEKVTLVKYTVFADSIRNQNCKKKVQEDMKKAKIISIEEQYQNQERYLKKYWEMALVDIEGDEELSLAVRYNQYQLIQSVSKDKFGNIAAKGLSGEGYEGHIFWDTEMYIQPMFSLINPEVSKNLIEYRYGILEEAKEHSKILGHKKGALYPWRTIMGKECSGYFPSGSAQYHINGDIAHSIVQYYLLTKDLAFIGEKGGEILFETARLWIDTGNYYEGTFRINDVTGPDEYTCIVNNNYYTNVSAQYNLRWAVKFYYLLQEASLLDDVEERTRITKEEIEEFSKAAENMYLPYDTKLKINPQDDSFLEKEIWDIAGTPKEQFPLLLHFHPLYLYRHQVCKQADTVLAHFVFEDAQSVEVIRNSFLYYEKVTTHDSSLSRCIYSIVASKLGMEEKAYDYFGDSAKLDLFNTHDNTKDGIHTANMGGTYMSIVYGFGGLRIKEEGIFFAPILPSSWKGYRFKINYEGSQIQIAVENLRTIFTRINGNKKKIYVYGEEYELIDELIVERPI